MGASSTGAQTNTDPSLTGDEGNGRMEELKELVEGLTPEDFQMLQEIVEERAEQEKEGEDGAGKDKGVDDGSGGNEVDISGDM